MSLKSTEVVMKSPKAITFILVNIFFERFCTAGTSAILALYFHIKLNLDPDLSTSVFHIHEFLGYSFTIVGAIIADSWWGHFKAIVWMAFIYSLGSALVAVGNIEPLNLSTLSFTIIGLIPMIIGAGSIRANLSVFGANQFQLPQQANKLTSYFSLQYFVLKSGSVIGRLVTPILRQDVKCFGMNDCYPLAFGVTSSVMFAGFVILVCGNSRYIKKPPSGNMLIKVCRCFMYGFVGKVNSIFGEKHEKDHWLDYAEEKSEPKILSDTKAIVDILVLFLPLPIFWAIYVQQGSRWVFQAARMNGDFGFYVIKPDQIIILNSILGILMIPVCEYVLYPLLAKIGLKSLLQKMTIGGLLAGVSFILSAFVEMKIEKDFINIFWLLPQYLILALGENFLYIANITFAYKEAPESMKSAMTAFIFIAIAIGNLIVALISGIRIFQSSATELFFFAGIMFANQIVFGWLAWSYKYKNRDPDEKVLSET